MLGWMKKLFRRRRPARAVIVSDGCRDYVVRFEADENGGLPHRLRHPQRYQSLQAACDAASTADNIVLSIRVAADEACAGKVEDGAAFHDIPIVKRAA